MEHGASSSNNNTAGGAGCGETVVIDQGRRSSSCGYCGSKGSFSVSHGLWATSLSAYDYQELLDRGWRRSGCYLYKPEMESTCCPSYTIRLKASDFCPSKEQVRVHKKMERFLAGTLSSNKHEGLKQKFKSHKDIGKLMNNDSLISKATSSEKESPVATCEKKCKEDIVLESLSNKIDDAVNALIGSEYTFTDQVPKANVKHVTQVKKKQIEIAEDLLYTSSISFQLAAFIKRSQSKSRTDGCNSELSDVSPIVIADKLVLFLEKEGEGVITKACKGHLNFYSPTSGMNSKCITHKKIIVSQIDKGCTEKSYTTDANMVSLSHKRKILEIYIKRSSFDPEEFALYKKYQIKVHQDKPEEVLESSYKRFLVDTPITFIPPESDNHVPPCGFGSFHQQYRIDGKLIAVGVIDILPRCLSSKYLFWDPEFAFLSLGKYTALQEINLVKENGKNCYSHQYCYLGYYIHSCRKMRYKAAYRPSELLCPLHYKWVSFEIARPLLDRKAYVVLSNYLALQDTVSLQELSDFVKPLGTGDHNEIMYNGDSSDEDEELASDYEDMDTYIENESTIETNDENTADDLSSSNIGDVMFDVNGKRVRFKNLGRLFGPIQEKVLAELEKQLCKYIKVVGNELAGRMVYSFY